MEQGLGVDDIIGRFPDQAADLRPFLMTAAALPALAAQPSVTAERDSRRAFLAEADRRAAEATTTRQAAGWLWRLLAPALAVLAVMFLGGAGLVRASSGAVPGDALYTTKRFVEETRLNLTADPERAAELREQFRRERIDEIEQLLADGREADVSLTGEITAMDGDAWTVDGLPVAVPAGATIEGTPFVGAQVQVDGRAAGGAVTATRVMVLAGVQPPPTPTPPAPTPTPTTPAPTPTPPAPTPTAGPVESQPGAQPVVPATQPPPTSPPPASPPPQPTTPPPGDNDNDNDDWDDWDDNDNGNDLWEEPADGNDNTWDDWDDDDNANDAWEDWIDNDNDDDSDDDNDND